MPGENLTRAEAAERAGVVSVESYDVALDLTTEPETFRAVTTVRFASREGASTFLDLIAESVEHVEVNGKSLDPAEVVSDSRVHLRALAASNTVRITSTQRYTNSGEGLHRFVDPADGEVYLYSQFEVPDSRRMFAVFEQPDLKATFRFTVTAPARWEVVSTQPTPHSTAAGEKDGEAIATWEFEPTAVISSYVTALIAGPYRSVRGETTSSDGRTIALGVFCRRSLSEHLDADYILETTRRGFAFFEELFDYPYPFAKYDQLFVPEHSAGAMENVGAVTFIEEFVFRGRVTDSTREDRVATILHEMAHMWFGNLVTMRWWNDLWLNESFADYVATLATVEATEWTQGWATFASSDKAWAYRQDQLPSTHPIAAEVSDLEDALTNFDGITYAKGASVLKQLVAWVGREPFMRGVHDYFTKHHHANTELTDLLTELEARSGRDLTAWSNLWLETAGVNTLRPVFELDASGRYVSFAIEQTATPEHPAIRPHRIAIGLYARQGDSVRRIHRIECDISGAVTPVPELIGTAQPDLLLVNDDDLSYAKIRLDERSLRTAANHLGDIDDALARALIWGTLWDATRDAELRASHFIDILLTHAGSERNSTTLRTLLGQLGDAVTTYLPAQGRATTRAHAAHELWQLANHAEEGSDAQFQFVTAFAELAIGSGQLDIVQGLLDGTKVLGGLTIDTDLGWTLLTALAAGGRGTDAQIAARLAQDRTAAGELAAVRARAALATPEGKARAWAMVFERGDVSNHTVEAAGVGFRQLHDASLLTPYVEPFLSALLPIWESRTYVIVEQLVEGFYPSPLASEELADATRRWLDAHPDVADPLRRMLSEHLADVERALAAQECERRHRTSKEAAYA
ncbi:aminopeptidase N [Mycobacteroides immunogenum]|uniref:Aminopeptidase N n=1 Tax=Mycobacteroides immunogenum TaxID=83262 RepID=A0A179VFK4_9MYCO|nr:aminopeptidase N [Mycobacteroides immunogenum]OAT70629.1 aminopeptidase N [Mycobacteroides immunogenum]